MSVGPASLLSYIVKIGVNDTVQGNKIITIKMIITVFPDVKTFISLQLKR
jgi:hypothetical protein